MTEQQCVIFCQCNVASKMLTRPVASVMVGELCGMGPPLWSPGMPPDAPVPLLTVHALARALQETLKACPGRRDRGGTPLQQRSCRLLSDIRQSCQGPVSATVQQPRAVCDRPVMGFARVFPLPEHCPARACPCDIWRQMECTGADMTDLLSGMHRHPMQARCYCAKTGSLLAVH